MKDRNQLKGEILEHFGDENLPDELQRAVDSDPELGHEWQALRALDALMPGEEEFFLPPAEIEALCLRVERQIDSAPPELTSIPWHITPIWRRSLAIAATVVFIVGGSLMIDRLRQFDQSDPSDSSVQMPAETVATEEIEVSQPMYDALLLDYTNRASAEPALLLLEDLTEDEYEYLNNNFDVEELLL